MKGTHDLDVPARQVLLDAVVYEASHEDLARRLRKPAEIWTSSMSFYFRKWSDLEEKDDSDLPCSTRTQ